MFHSGYNYFENFAVIAAITGILIVACLAILGISLALYVLRSIGWMTLAKRRGLACPWLAWVPVAGSYTIGAVADDISAKEGESSIFRFLLLGGSILNLLFSGSFLGVLTYYLTGVILAGISTLLVPSGTSVFGFIVLLALYVLEIIVLNRVFRCYQPKYATLWTVLCAIPFLAFLQSIFPFTIRNNQPNWLRTFYEDAVPPPPEQPENNEKQ